MVLYLENDKMNVVYMFLFYERVKGLIDYIFRIYFFWRNWVLFFVFYFNFVLIFLFSIEL